MIDRRLSALYRLGDRFGRALCGTARHYVVIVRGGSEGAGYESLRLLTRGGPRYWLALAMLVVTILATAYLGFQRHEIPAISAEVFEGERLSLPVAALWLTPLIMAFGFAYLLIGATGLGIWAYPTAAAYVMFFAVSPGLGRARSLWFAALPLWVMIQGAWLLSDQPPRRRLLPLLLLCLLSGSLTYPAIGAPLGLHGPWSQYLLGLIYFVLLGTVTALRPLQFVESIAFGITLTVLLAFCLLAALQSPPAQLLELSFIGYHNLLGILGLFWYWMGLDLFNSSLDLARWATLAVRRLIPGGIVRVAIFAAWVAVMGYGCLAISTPPIAVIEWLSRAPWGRALLEQYVGWEPSFLVTMTMEYGLYVTGIVLLIAIVLSAMRKLSTDRLIGLFSLSILAFLVILGGMGLFMAFGSSTQMSADVLGFWPLLIYVAGMFWEVLKNSANLLSGNRTRLPLFSGFVLCLAGISLLELSAHFALFQQELSLNALSGVIYLGIPYLLYTYLYEQKRYTPVSRRHLLLLFGMGMLCAIPVHLGLPLYAVPLIWLGVTLVSVWRWGSWDDPLDSIVRAVAMGLGFLIFYARPVTFPVPLYTEFALRLTKIQSGYSGLVTWPWEARWWKLVVAVLLAATSAGYAWIWALRARRWARVSLLMLGTAFASGILAVIASTI